jgi:hypothetical protein
VPSTGGTAGAVQGGSGPTGGVPSTGGGPVSGGTPHTGGATSAAGEAGRAAQAPTNTAATESGESPGCTCSAARSDRIPLATLVGLLGACAGALARRRTRTRRPG